MRVRVHFLLSWLTIAHAHSLPWVDRPSVRIHLNPHSVTPTAKWPNQEDLLGELNFEIADTTFMDGRPLIHFFDGSSLLVWEDIAELFDSDDEQLGNIIFQPGSAVVERHLNGKKKRRYDVAPAPPPAPIDPTPVHVHQLPPPPPAIEGAYKAYPSEMYCRYGCGNIMGVTFPYYYRPFFGYGFPLLGTEPSFPTGYGGNPITPLGVSGQLGPPAPPGSVAFPGAGVVPPF